MIITATLAGDNLIALIGIIGPGAGIIGTGIIGGNATGTAGTTTTKLLPFRD